MTKHKNTTSAEEVTITGRNVNTQAPKDIKRRRLSWFGHLLRLHNNTPAKLALKEFIRETQRPPGKPKTTWLSQIKKRPPKNKKNNPHDLEHVSRLTNDRTIKQSNAL